MVLALHLLLLLGKHNNGNRGLRRSHPQQLHRSNHRNNRPSSRHCHLRLHDQRHRHHRRRDPKEKSIIRVISRHHPQAEGTL